jgi:Tol biopolymer transport system component
VTGRIAFVGADRQVHVVNARGRAHRQVTFSSGPGALTPWGVPVSRDHSSWPCWSPDGRWLACFQSHTAPEGGGPAWLTVLEVDGVEERRLAQLSDGLPIYIQWNAQARSVAALIQVEDQLELSVCEIGEIGGQRLVEQGVPLFFSWLPDGRRLLVHTGERGGNKRLVGRSADGDGHDAIFADIPGSFCTPVVLDQQVVYVTPRGQGEDLCIGDLDGQRQRVLAEVDGLVAVIPSPDGTALAYSTAKRGREAIYDGIRMIRTDGTGDDPLYEGPSKAFLWSPNGKQIVVAAPGRRQPGLDWRSIDVETGESRHVCTFWPSQDQMFYLHFFEQFSQSHPLISPDGSLLVFSGHPAPVDTGEDVRSRIYVVSLEDEDAKPKSIALGDFAVFSHR